MNTRRVTLGLATRLQRFSLGYAPVPWWHGHLGRVADRAGKMPAPPLGLMQLRTALVMVCCLALWGFASPAAAKPIVVTTLADTADPPFNTDGPCGTGTISNLPGADGLISLREAIIAANNTPGAQTITFAPNLNGGTIVVNFDDLDADADPDPLPALCEGHTRIDGDLNGDDVPDITLEGAAFPAPSRVPGLSIISSRNTLNGLQVQHFPIGIRILAGDGTNPGTITHTTVTNNTLSESTDGLIIVTSNAPGSAITDTAITQNLILNNARFGILVLANQSAAGSDTHITHTTITDNEVTGNGGSGIAMASLGTHNAITEMLIARNITSGNGAGINVTGGGLGAEGNTTEVRIKNNTTTDNADAGIYVVGGQDNSSNNHVVVQVQGNTMERNGLVGITVSGGGGAVLFPAGTSVGNEVDATIEKNTVRDQNGRGIVVTAGFGSFEDPPNPDAVADHNHVSAIIRQNVVQESMVRGIELAAGFVGLASANTLDVRVEQNTVCHNTGTDIMGEGGFTGNALYPVPNQGTGNVLAGRIAQNTATTVTVANGTPGNTATVKQSNNAPCP